MDEGIRGKIRKLKKVDAIRCLKRQTVNAEEATIRQLQRRNIFLTNVYKRASEE